MGTKYENLVEILVRNKDEERLKKVAKIVDSSSLKSLFPK